MTTSYFQNMVKIHKCLFVLPIVIYG